MQRRKRDWNKLHGEYKLSGLSITAFARSKGIPTSTISTHFRLIEAATDNNDNYDDVVFSKVEVISKDYTDCKSDYGTITLKTGKIDIVLNDDFNEELLTKALKVVCSLC